MATSNDSINFQFTAQGQQLATQALAGNTKLDFTKAVASTDNHFSDDAATIAALTTLGHVKQTATITEVETVTNDDTEVRIPVTFDKSQVGDDYQLLTVGLYCKPDNGAEVLYAVAGLANPILMHQSVAGSVYSIALYVLVGTAENVTIKVDPAGSITQADLTAILAEYVKSADIKTVAYTDKPNVFTQQQTLSAGAVDGAGHAYVTEDKVPKTDLTGLQPKGDYAKTVDVNQQLDKKVNIADMRKPASDVAGIEEVNAKQDKLTITPADDSKVVHDNHDGTISINGNSFTPSVLDSAAGINSQPIDTDVNTLVKPGLYYVSGIAPNNPFKTNMMLETRVQYNWHTFEGFQIAYQLLNGLGGIALRYVNPKGDLTGGGVGSWTFLSDDSKVVHSADMRKPASDVAGIDEVSTLQTQVDNSAVGTNLLLNTGNLSSTSTTTSWSTLFDSSQVYDSRIKSLSGVSAMTFSFFVYIPSNAEVGSTIPIQFKGQNSQAMNTAGDDWNTLIGSSGYVIEQNDLGKTICTSFSIGKGNNYQSFDTALADTARIIIRQSTSTPGFVYSKIKLEKGSVATDWCPNPEDKVNVADMRKPASDVAGIEEVNAKQDKLAFTPADDSTVVHTADMSKYYTAAQVDTALSKKVTDNGDGSVTVNGAKMVIMQQADVQKLIDAAVATATTTLKKYADDAKQGAIDQIQPMVTAEFTKRNAPSLWWNGTATAYAAITPKVADAEYDVTES